MNPSVTTVASVRADPLIIHLGNTVSPSRQTPETTPNEGTYRFLAFLPIYVI